MALVNARPSIEKQKEVAEAEQARFSERRSKLASKGLKLTEEEKALEEAVAKNEAPIPDEVLTCVPVPGTDSINFHHVKSFGVDGTEQHPRFDMRKLPVHGCLDHVNTNFVYMFVVMDTSVLDRQARRYMPLILEAIGECPIERNGKIIPYEQVVAEIEADTIAADCRMGFEGMAKFGCGAYSHSANLMLQLEMGKYTKGIQWIRELLYDAKFNPERLKIIASKMMNEITICKKKGHKICGDLMKGLMFSEDSNHFNSSLMRQQMFLGGIVERLGTEGQKVVGEIEGILRKITDPSNILVYIATNVDKLSSQVEDLYGPWEALKAKDFEKKK